MAQCDQLLSGANQHLETFDAVRPKWRGVIQLRFVILIKRRMNFLGLFTKQFLAGVHKMLHVGLSAATKHSVFVTEEITTQVMLRFLNDLQLLIPRIRL